MVMAWFSPDANNEWRRLLTEAEPGLATLAEVLAGRAFNDLALTRGTGDCDPKFCAEDAAIFIPLKGSGEGSSCNAQATTNALLKTIA